MSHGTNRGKVISMTPDKNSGIIEISDPQPDQPGQITFLDVGTQGKKIHVQSDVTFFWATVTSEPPDGTKKTPYAIELVKDDGGE